LKLRLTVDGKIYEVEVEITEQDRRQRGLAQPAVSSSVAAPIADSVPAVVSPRLTDAGPSDESKLFRSPVSGVVMRVPTQVGQSVKENDVLMVVEAMKMETVLASQSDGKISQIHAGVGDAVQVKQVLVEFE
jgi:methylmalonyl-CoA carboxyltransferase small subunit